jgi:hypothetical protein
MGIEAKRCEDAALLAEEIQEGAGAVVIADEALTLTSLRIVGEAIRTSRPGRICQ